MNTLPKGSRLTSRSPLLLLAALLLSGCVAVPRGDVAERHARDIAAQHGDVPGRAFRDCPDCPELVVIPAGRFVMGTPPEDDETWSLEREGPRREVTIPRAFALGRFEVTRREFARYVEAAGLEAAGRAPRGCAFWDADNRNGPRWQGDADRDWRRPGFAQADDHPVVCVSAADAAGYVEWLSARTGQRYRLASESEWEYAARAGTTTRRYWGDAANEACAHANLADRTLAWAGGVECEDGHRHTASVGSFRPNAFGLHDMIGNVWEWTADCWDVGYVNAPADGSARRDGDCTQRVARGAGWSSNARNGRSSNRGNYQAGVPYESVGLRVVRELP